ncbi:MAG: hypothetical protein FWE85_02970 [Clostridiales bacterium]|nr:hypothetical protein [Clostridiales bacterium]
MKKLILTVWGGHLGLCLLGFVVVAYVFALALAHRLSLIPAIIILILASLIVSFLYAVLGYISNNNRYNKPLHVILSVSIVCVAILILSKSTNSFLIKWDTPYFMLNRLRWNKQ